MVTNLSTAHASVINFKEEEEWVVRNKGIRR
jgi:hypothetical protein